MARRAIFAVVAAVLVCGLTVVRAADWPCWRGPNRDGKSLETGLLKEWPEGGPKLVWKVNGLGEGFSTVAVSEGKVYATGDVGGKLVVFAFNMEGKLLWKAAVDDAWTRSTPGSRSTPTIDEGKLYVLSGDGLAVCLDAGSGAMKWSRDLRGLGGSPGGWGYAESVLIMGDRAIVKPGGGNCIVALDKKTGAEIWKSTGIKAGPEYSSCVPVNYAGVEGIATGTAGGLVCVAAGTGKLLWSNSFSAGNTANCPDPAVADGYVFWANGYGKGGICMKLSASGSLMSAQEAWRTQDMVCHHGGYIIDNGYIYGNHNGGYSCVELETGAVKWNGRAVGKGSLCYADGMLYLFGESGGKAALATCTPGGLEIKGQVTVAGSGPSWAHPVVAGGRLYLRYAENLYCFDVKADSGEQKRVSLFDGKTLDGWTVLKCEAGVDDGDILIKEGNGLVQTEKMYGDFVFEFEWKALREDKWDSGVYFRYVSVPENRPWPGQHQANLLKGQEGNVGTLEGATSTGLIKAGEWNTFKLRVQGTKAGLEINGKRAWEADGLGEPKMGYIALQAEVPGGGRHRFRNIYITELASQ